MFSAKMALKVKDITITEQERKTVQTMCVSVMEHVKGEGDGSPREETSVEGSDGRETDIVEQHIKM